MGTKQAKTHLALKRLWPHQQRADMQLCKQVANACTVLATIHMLYHWQDLHLKMCGVCILPSDTHTPYISKCRSCEG